MSHSYDLAVIGSGPGGYAAALAGARRGLRTCVIERERWGGVCLNVGCIPTKAMLHVARQYRRLGRLTSLGIELDGYRLNFDTVRRRTEAIVSTLRQGLTGVLRQEGVELVPGQASFDDANTLRIEHDGNIEPLHARWVVIATGATPSPGPWKFDEQRILSYRGALSLEQVPGSLLIIGGGAIGCEFASCYSAFGTKVTLIEQQPSILPSEDPDAVRWILRALQAQGVEVLAGTLVESLTSSDQGVEVHVAGRRLQAERCLVAIGQRPNIASLRLDRAGIASGQGITVDQFLRTSQPHIAAIGDCLESHGLAHWASSEGALAVRNLLETPEAALPASQVPRCVFTDPEIAHIGDAGTGETRVSRLSLGALGKSHCDDETEGFVKLTVDAATDQVRAATIVGAQASTLIHYAVLAVRLGLTARQLAGTITAHPTMPEAITEAAAHLYGESLAAATRTRRPAAS